MWIFGFGLCKVELCRIDGLVVFGLGGVLNLRGFGFGVDRWLFTSGVGRFDVFVYC